MTAAKVGQSMEMMARGAWDAWNVPTGRMAAQDAAKALAELKETRHEQNVNRLIEAQQDITEATKS